MTFKQMKHSALPTLSNFLTTKPNASHHMSFPSTSHQGVFWYYLCGMVALQFSNITTLDEALIGTKTLLAVSSAHVLVRVNIFFPDVTITSTCSPPTGAHAYYPWYSCEQGKCAFTALVLMKKNPDQGSCSCKAMLSVPGKSTHCCFHMTCWSHVSGALKAVCAPVEGFPWL